MKEYQMVCTLVMESIDLNTPINASAGGGGVPCRKSLGRGGGEGRARTGAVVAVPVVHAHNLHILF